MDDRITLQEIIESVDSDNCKSPEQVTKDSKCSPETGEFYLTNDSSSLEGLVKPKEDIPKEKVKRLKKNEYEIVICPKCKKPLRYYPFHNDFICLTDNIECRISH